MSNASLLDMASQIREFCQERDWDRFHGPKDLAIGLVTEAAELLELFRFQTPEQLELLLKNPEMRQKIGQELADVLFFLMRFSDRFGFDLEKEFLNKMSLNQKKYPSSEFRGRNHKYNREPLDD